MSCLPIYSHVLPCLVVNLRRTLKVDAAYNAIGAANADDKPLATKYWENLEAQMEILNQQRGELHMQLSTGVWGFTDTRPVQFCRGLLMALCAQTHLPST